MQKEILWGKFVGKRPPGGPKNEMGG